MGQDSSIKGFATLRQPLMDGLGVKSAPLINEQTREGKQQLKSLLVQVTELNKSLSDAVVQYNLLNEQLKADPSKTATHQQHIADLLVKVQFSINKATELLQVTEHKTLYELAYNRYEQRHLQKNGWIDLIRDPRRSTTLALMSQIRHQELHLHQHVENFKRLAQHVNVQSSTHVLSTQLAKVNQICSKKLHLKNTDVHATDEDLDGLLSVIDREPQPKRFLSVSDSIRQKKDLAQILLVLSNNPQSLVNGFPPEYSQVYWTYLVALFPDCRKLDAIHWALVRAQKSGRPFSPELLIYLHCPTLKATPQKGETQSQANQRFDRSMGGMRLSRNNRLVKHLFLCSPFERRKYMHEMYWPSMDNDAFLFHTYTFSDLNLNGFQSVFNSFFTRVTRAVDEIRHETYTVRPKEICGDNVKYSQLVSRGKRSWLRDTFGVFHDKHKFLIEQRQLVYKRSDQELNDLVDFFSDPNNIHHMNQLAQGFVRFLHDEPIISGRPVASRVEKLVQQKYLQVSSDGSKKIIGPVFDFKLLEQQLHNMLGQGADADAEGTSASPQSPPSLISSLTKVYKLAQARSFNDCTPVLNTPATYDLGGPGFGGLQHLLTDTADLNMMVEQVNQLFAIKDVIEGAPHLFKSPVDTSGKTPSVWMYKKINGHRVFGGVSNRDNLFGHELYLRTAFHAYHMQVRLKAMQDSINNPIKRNLPDAVANPGTPSAGKVFPGGDVLETLVRMRQRVKLGE